MKPLIITEFGTHITVQGRMLQVNHGATGPVDRYQPQQLPFDSVVLDSNTGSISLEALRFLAVHDIPITLMRWNGTILSTTLPRGPAHGKLRLAQAAAYGSKTRRLRIARALIQEKVAKTLDLTRHLAKYYPSELEPVEAAARDSIGKTISELRTYEGRVARAYWKEYGKAIETHWPDSGFRGRKQKTRSWNNNAADPTNALLNYGYALLESECRSALTKAGLLPEFGFMHEPAPSKLPLAYDLQEPFRWVVDLSVLESIRDGHLDRKRDFIVTENYHVRLRPAAAKALADRLSINMNRIVTTNGRRRSYQSIALDIARQLSKHLLDQRTNPDFTSPFAVEDEYHIETRLAKQIAELELTEAPKIGISKSGLLYIQRRIASGKPLKLYGKVGTKLRSYLETFATH